MWKWVGISCVVLLTVTHSAAQDDAAPPTFVVFDPPIEATIRSTDGRSVQGLLAWADEEGAHFTSNTGKKLFFPVKNVKEIKTTRSQFHYRANVDDYFVSIQKARRLQPQAVVVDSPEEEPSEPETKPTPKAKAPDPIVLAETNPASSAENAEPARKVFECSKCGHHVAVENSKTGQFAFCPKCGANQTAGSPELHSESSPEGIQPNVEQPEAEPLADEPNKIIINPANLVVIGLLVGVIVTLALSKREPELHQVGSRKTQSESSEGR